MDIFSLERNHLSIECRFFEDKECCCQRFSRRRWVPDDHIWSIFIFNRSTLQNHCIKLVLQDPCLSLQCIVLRNRCLRKTVYIQIDITRSLHLIGLARSLPFIAMHCSSQQMFEQTVVPNFALGNFPEARRIRFNLPKTAQNHFSSSKIYWFITNYLWFCTNKILKERQWPHIFFSRKALCMVWLLSVVLALPWVWTNVKNLPINISFPFCLHCHYCLGSGQM